MQNQVQPIRNIYMDPENHRLLAEAIYQKVIEIEGILG